MYYQCFFRSFSVLIEKNAYGSMTAGSVSHTTTIPPVSLATSVLLNKTTQEREAHCHYIAYISTSKLLLYRRSYTAVQWKKALAILISEPQSHTL